MRFSASAVSGPGLCVVTFSKPGLRAWARQMGSANCRLMRPISCTISVRWLEQFHQFTSRHLSTAGNRELFHAHWLFDSKPLASSRARASSLAEVRDWRRSLRWRVQKRYPRLRHRRRRPRSAPDPRWKCRIQPPAAAWSRRASQSPAAPRCRNIVPFTGDAGARNQINESSGILGHQFQTPPAAGGRRQEYGVETGVAHHMNILLGLFDAQVSKQAAIDAAGRRSLRRECRGPRAE